MQCTALNLWLLSYPVVDKVVTGKSHEVYSYLHAGMSQIGQPFPYAESDFKTAAMGVVRKTYVQMTGMKNSKYAAIILG